MGGVKSRLILVIIDLLAYTAVPPTGQLQVLGRKYFIRDRFWLSLGIRVLGIQKIRGPGHLASDTHRSLEYSITQPRLSHTLSFHLVPHVRTVKPYAVRVHSLSL